jgi:hypothetical protein
MREMKFGILLPCPECGGLQRSKLAYAYAFAFPDHVLDLEQLRQISAAIVAGEPAPRLPPGQVTQVLAAYGHLSREESSSDP